MWGNLGSALAGVMFMWAMFQQYFPNDLRKLLEKHANRVAKLFYPYIHITFNEYSTDDFIRSDLYISIQTYLSHSSACTQASRLTAEFSSSKTTAASSPSSFFLSIADQEEVQDLFNGVPLYWSSNSISPRSQPFFFRHPPDDRRYYKLTFHRRHRHLVTSTYLPHVLAQGKVIITSNRQRKLFTNHESRWKHVLLDHPASFHTIAMDSQKKQEIVDDLVAFSKAGEFYRRVGKAWKRGYLLYGPPGTGKSTMVAAMANLLSYDIYDLELTAVEDNTQLRKLLIHTTSKSIMVIEDIDCSLDLTGQRKREEDEDEDEEEEEGERKNRSKLSKVTLSGLLNFIDGVWSASKGERIIVFTTNVKDKLDPALVRKGRMDKHIELSFCGFEGFKVLAKNYWEVEDHPAFEKIGRLLEETEVTPADVSECLMPTAETKDASDCFACLIQYLEKAKEERAPPFEKVETEEKKVDNGDVKEENRDCMVGHNGSCNGTVSKTSHA